MGLWDRDWYARHQWRRVIEDDFRSTGPTPAPRARPRATRPSWFGRGSVLWVLAWTTVLCYGVFKVVAFVATHLRG